MAKRALLFPGQGSQYVGMASDLYENSVEAKEMIKTADAALGVPLSHIMFNGPEEELKQTEYTQPAIFVHSVVLASLLRRLDFEGAAGHSLGEYSALVACGAIQYYDAVQLVRFRGQGMQQAGTDFPGTMAAVIGLDRETLENICKEASAEGIVQCANFNSPGQIVISGSVSGVLKGMELAKAAKARLVSQLTVSGAFHSPLMQSAKDQLRLKLDSVNFYDAKFPVYANVTGKPEKDKEEIKQNLFLQVTAPVMWEDTIRNMIADGFDEFVEVGPGRVLQGLVKRINPAVVTSGIDKFADIEKYL
ncbi:MAG: ACP S-malonyltransferase [Ignavibacteriaceae bacterium]|jgi:[acyl-carrier-protein] S-malonyltransferase|nr:ACP S-malonyltransferase [Ignavibacteriales bacterium]MBP9122856.1 ACP S-malonyltransferase [Ignavibacteriaceae bacterium]